MIEDTDNAARHSLGPILTWSILVSFASGVGYMAVYAYDLGASMYFSIPCEFISISTVNLVAVAIAGLLLVYILPPAASFVPSTFFREMGSHWLILPMLASVSVLTILSAVQGVFPRTGIIGLSILVVLLWVMFITLSILRASGRLRHRRETALPPIEHLAQFMPRQTAVSLVGIVLLLLLVAEVAYSSGFFVSKYRVSFAVTDERQPKVILAIYGDTAIAADFNTGQKNVTERFTVFKVGQISRHSQSSTSGP